MSVTINQDTKTITVDDKPQSLITKEVKAELTTLIYTEIPTAVSKYEARVSYTGGVLSRSMTIAYQQGLMDAIKLINKETK